MIPTKGNPQAESWVEIMAGLCGCLWAAAAIMIVVAWLAGCAMPCQTRCVDKACTTECTPIRW